MRGPDHFGADQGRKDPAGRVPARIPYERSANCAAQFARLDKNDNFQNRADRQAGERRRAGKTCRAGLPCLCRSWISASRMSDVYGRTEFLSVTRATICFSPLRHAVCWAAPIIKSANYPVQLDSAPGRVIILKTQFYKNFLYIYSAREGRTKGRRSRAAPAGPAADGYR